MPDRAPLMPERILTALREARRPLAYSEIAAAVGATRQSAVSITQHLMRVGLVVGDRAPVSRYRPRTFTVASCAHLLPITTRTQSEAKMGWNGQFSPHAIAWAASVWTWWQRGGTGK